ncbi:Uncharacterized protein TCM_023606 [Theobroma cacao]|uniref:Uncharacterized protein n=1 Tax=Theobroma cacao TaxID=3641 RepID=A0A061EVL6_THECC|nr:Uncharacterized protein TCM_023606 [Theobroma cacao]
MLSLARFQLTFRVMNVYQDVVVVVTGSMGVSGLDNSIGIRAFGFKVILKIYNVLRYAGDTHTISRRDSSPDASHSIREGSLDSTAKSRWQPKPSSPKSAYSNNINISMRDSLFRESKEYVKEMGKLRIAEGGIRPRKGVSVVQHYPPGCGVM